MKRCILLTIVFLLAFVALHMQVDASLYLRTTIGASKPHYNPTVRNWIQGRFDSCSAEVPCTSALKLSAVYTNHKIDASLVLIGELTIFKRDTHEVLYESEKEFKFVKSALKDDEYTIEAPQQLLPFGASLEDGFDFILELQRIRADSEANVSSISVTIGDETLSVDMIGTSNDLYLYPTYSAPQATMVIGQDADIGTNTPYDNQIHLDFDLSWNDFDKLIFDRIWIKPQGFAFLSNDPTSYECLLGGSLLTDIEIVTRDEIMPGYYYLQINDVAQFTRHESFKFKSGSRLQLQCAFPNKNIKPDGSVEKPTLVTEFVGYSLVLNAIKDVGDVGADDETQNPAVWFASKNVDHISPLNIYVVPKDAYIVSIGDTPAYSIQSRFVQLLDTPAQRDPKTTKREYMSHYYVSFPLALPESYTAKKALLYNPAVFREFLQVNVQGNEMFLEDSLEYTQFFVTCIHQTAQPNLVRTYIVAFGDFDYETRTIMGPAAPRSNSVRITKPSVAYNNRFLLSPDGLDQEDGLPQCIQFSLDIGVGTYNAYDKKTDPMKMDSIFNVKDTLNNPTSIRLAHFVNNETDVEKQVGLRHDWISSFALDSARENPYPANSLYFDIVNVNENHYNKAVKYQYFTFDMLISTTGLKKQDSHPFDNTMSFTLQIISGLYQFKIPDADPSTGRIPSIECNIEYYDKTTKKNVKTVMPSSVISDRRISFEIVDEEHYSKGLPYDTEDIKISCPNKILGVKKIDHSDSKDTDKIYLNVALLVDQRQTFIGSVFGHKTDPARHNNGGISGVAVFFIILLLIAATVGAFAVYNHLTNGSVVRFIYTHIPPFDNSIRSSSAGKYQGQQDTGYGTYGDVESLN